jgi:PAS domain S-box-containing protein
MTTKPLSLIVDDKEENRYYLRTLLAAYGYGVDSAVNGAEALAKAGHSPPSLVIADLLMPVMDGYTLLRHWKLDEKLTDIPFIVYTATYTAPEDERLAIDLGADAFIVKPMEPDQLMARIRRVHSHVIDAGSKSAHAPSANDQDIVTQYSATLVRKLEQKTIQLETANRALQREVTERSRIALVQTGILNALPAHVALLDSDGIILEVNDPWRRFVTADGLQSPDFAVGRNYLQICDDAEPSWSDEARTVAAGVRRILAGEASEFSLEYPCHSPAQKRWFCLVVTPLRQFERSGPVVTHVDITQRKLDEANVQEVSKRLETLIEQANIGILVHRDFRPIMANSEMARIFGYDGKDDIRNMPDCKVLFAESEWARIEAYNKERLKGGDVPRFYSLRGRRRDGGIIDLESRAFAIQWGDRSAACSMLTDVTEQRKIEARLRQSQRLEAVGQMTGGIAHDFNNLLTVIIGNSELMEETDDPFQRGLAEMVRKAAERGAELTSRLLAFSRRQPLDPKAIDINLLISNMDGLIRRAIGGQFEITTVLGDGLWRVFVDPSQLENALLNLAINARDAMANGGRLTIETSNIRIDDADVADDAGSAPGDYLLVAVSDTGAGMDKDTLAHAFEPFFTTKEVGKGSGLGLSMVYGFVTQSRGHVRIHSELGQGTTVRIYLPRAADDVALAGQEIRDGSLPRGSEKILLVEDDAMVRDMVMMQLVNLGYRVVSAVGASEALQLLHREDGFDLLLTDVVMPGGLNGRELADEARKFCPGLRVIFTSGYAENAVAHDGRLDSGVHLLNKPYRRSVLAMKIRAALAQEAS